MAVFDPTHEKPLIKPGSVREHSIGVPAKGPLAGKDDVSLSIPGSLSALRCLSLRECECMTHKSKVAVSNLMSSKHLDLGHVKVRPVSYVFVGTTEPGNGKTLQYLEIAFAVLTTVLLNFSISKRILLRRLAGLLTSWSFRLDVCIQRDYLTMIAHSASAQLCCGT